MKVLVTGAGGFLGQAITAAVAKAGHQVLAMYRPASLPDMAEFPSNVTVLPGDLRLRGEWCDALGGLDAVIHCAAAFGDLPTQLSGTVLATENLLAALPSSLTRFVHISSFSVYDFDAPGWRGVLDEDSAIEKAPLRRDAYTFTKLQQEAMIRSYASDRQRQLIVLRPGAIYGPGKDWDHGRAMQAGRFDLIFAPLSRMRLIHVGNCADAAVSALTAPCTGTLAINLVDAEQPTHWRYHRLARHSGLADRIPLPVPYMVVIGLGWMAKLASRLFFKGRAKLPELLDPPRQRVRWRPLRYANRLAIEKLGWRQNITLEQGVASLRVLHGTNEQIETGS